MAIQECIQEMRVWGFAVSALWIAAAFSRPRNDGRSKESIKIQT